MWFLTYAFILLFITPLLSGPSNPATLAPAEQLIAELACAVCHSGLPEQTDIKDYAPELSDAGRRFNPAYLFSYLQNPTRVRPYVWPTRMPDFGFSPRETLALVLFLETQREEKLTKRESPAAVEASRSGDVAAGRTLIAGYECLKCHVLENDGQNESVDLTSVGFRLNANWVKRYLVAPARFDGTESGMPSFFYSWNASEDAFVEFLPEAADDIHSMTAFLFDIAGEKRERLQKAYLETKAANPGITAEMGEKIFISQNCAACHKTSFVRATTAWKNAPDLDLESERVKETWLRSYLKKPVAIRPFGYYPGTGSRMPDFKLSEKEVDILTGYLFRSQSIHDAATPGPAVKKLSAFSILKAEKFLQDKLSCLGCHKLGDEGGRIAPNLANVRNRLQGSYIRKIVRDPQALDRHSIMPKVQMPPKRLSLIIDYLLYALQTGVADTYLSLVEHPVHFYEKTSAATELFSRYCAACHGPEGGGDGFNARYLPKEPIKHSDAEYMSTRPDDTLFDGIFAGGAILNKSHMMPAWGATLKAEDIRTLVRHLRDLCQCRGPAWSEDNK